MLDSQLIDGRKGGSFREISTRSSHLSRWPGLAVRILAVFVLLLQEGAGAFPPKPLGSRPSEARFSGLAWAPFVSKENDRSFSKAAQPIPYGPVTRGNGGSGGIGRRPKPADLRSWALRIISQGGKLDRAVAMLEEAVRRSPRDPQLRSDLAAAYLARAEEQEDPADLFAALDKTREAIGLDERLREAWFNQALTLEKLFLPEARRAWKEYLRLDPASEWSDEAMAHLARLVLHRPSESWPEKRSVLLEASARQDLVTVREIVEGFQEASRALVEQELLEMWAEHQAAGSGEEATRVLLQARMIAQALEEIGKDSLLIDSVTVVEDALADPAHPDQLLKLIQGHEAYGKESFRQASDLLHQADSPFSRVADLSLATSLLERRDPASALDLLAAGPESVFYPNLNGRVAYLKGLVRAVMGDSSGAFDLYHSALAWFEQTGEGEQIGAVRNLLAEQYQLLGDTKNAWRHLRVTLQTVLPSEDVRRQLAALSGAASWALETDHPEVALSYQNESVHIASLSHNPAWIAFTLLRRSPLLYRLGRVEEALRDLRQAREKLTDIDSPEILRRVRADLAFAEGELALTREPRRAFTILADTIDFYRPLGNGAFLSRMYLTRARARISLRDDKGAMADLWEGIQAVERQRRRIAVDELRISYLDSSEDVYDEMIRLLVQQQDVSRAFDVAERSRSRTLLDRFSISPDNKNSMAMARPLRHMEVQSSLPRKVTLVEYAVQEDEILVWILTREHLTFRHIDMQKAALSTAVDRFRAAVRTGAGLAELEVISGDLYDALLRPVLLDITNGDSLVIVPDGPLHRLPFAALVDRATGRFLIEQRDLAFTPSATLYVRAMESDARKAVGDAEGLLAVGDPAFEGDDLFTLSSLPHARQESRAIAALYPSAEFLESGAATKGRFLSAAGRYATIHYAGHTLVDSDAPAFSRLVLAGQGGSASLYAREIYRANFSRTRLVVLASCNTAEGKTSDTEGILSLARSFLAANVPTVVATSWPIEDSAAPRLFLAFHSHRRTGESAASALRSAQLELLQSPDPSLRSPANWAGVVVIGGSQDH